MCHTCYYITSVSPDVECWHPGSLTCGTRVLPVLPATDVCLLPLLNPPWTPLSLCCSVWKPTSKIPVSALLILLTPHTATSPPLTLTLSPLHPLTLHTATSPSLTLTLPPLHPLTHTATSPSPHPSHCHLSTPSLTLPPLHPLTHTATSPSPHPSHCHLSTPSLTLPPLHPSHSHCHLCTPLSLTLAPLHPLIPHPSHCHLSTPSHSHCHLHPLTLHTATSPSPHPSPLTLPPLHPLTPEFWSRSPTTRADCRPWHWLHLHLPPPPVHRHTITLPLRAGP